MKKMNNAYNLWIILIITFIILIWKVDANAQNKSILRGNIIEKGTSIPVIGANVVEYDQNKRIITGTITDRNGNYVLTVSNPDAIIMFSLIGYKTQEIPMNRRTEINIELEPESYELEDVTVVATVSRDPLTNVSERDFASSRVKVDLGDAVHMGALSAEEALQGKVSGLDITSLSGDPGSGSAIVIRGLGSLGNARPLIVVDGIPQTVTYSSDFDFSSADQEDIGDLVNIAPQDIKSIEVLKDAASAAQWGSKGANGVLQIETFRGNKGKTQFDYQGKFTFERQPPAIPMLNGSEYIMLQLEEWHNAQGIYNVPPEIAYDRDFSDFYNYSANTDWVDAVSRNGFTQEYYFKVNGGGEKTRYFSSIDYSDSKGTTINQEFKRISTRINLDYNVSSKIRFSVNFSFSNNDKGGNYILNGQNIREMAYKKAPNMSIYRYNSDADLTGEYFTPIESYQGLGTDYFNPVAVGNLSTNDILENRVMNSFTLNYSILPWLRFMQVVSFQLVSAKRNSFLPYSAIGADWLDKEINQSSERNSMDTEIITRSQVYFTPNISKEHKLSGMLMLETDQLSSELSRLDGRNGPSTATQDPAGNPVISVIQSASALTHILGSMFSLNYIFKDRYITQMNLRADASSRFGTNNRWGIFPSIAVAWRFSEEPWFDQFEFISDGKIRYSYGQAGKQPGGAYDRHAIFNTANPNQYMTEPIVIPQQIQLVNLRWQTLTQNNFGLDLSFFKNRLNFTGEIYNKITEDLLWQNYSIPKASGFSILNWYNGGVVQNKGWELFINTLAFSKNKMKVSLNFNISHNSNTFMEFPENFNTEVDMTIGNAQYPRRAQIGEPIGSFYGFRYLGVWPSDEDVISYNSNGDVLTDPSGKMIPFSYLGTLKFRGGDARYADVNYDGKIDILDVVYLGDSNPDYIGGFGANLSWGDFRVSSQFQYRVGFKIVNEVAMETEGMLDRNNQSKAVLNRWRTPGQDEPGLLPRAYLGHQANNLGSDRYVENGDYLRMVNLTFSYKMPKKVCKRLNIRSMELALTTRRIFTWTNYSGVDPEIPQRIEDPFWFGTDNGKTPPPKAYTLSMALGF